MDGLIPQIIIKYAGSDSVIFQLRLDDCLLEKTGKSEHLSVIFEPLGLNPRNVVINGLFSLLLEVGGRLAFKLVQKGTRKRFSNEICFFTDFILGNNTGLVF
jgi:hypothetical protein